MDLAVSEREDRVAHIQHLRDLLVQGIEAVLPKESYVFNSSLDREMAAPHIVNIAFPPLNDQPLDGEMLILNFDMEGVCLSSGSACTSGAIEPSHVLIAMGRTEPTASTALRFSIGKDNTEEEISYTIDTLGQIIARMRGSVHA